MFRATHRPSSGDQNRTGSLCLFHTWKVVGRVVGGRCQAQCAWQRPPTTRPTTFHVWKTRSCQCSFRLLMMGGVPPETCWASDKYGIIKFWYTVASCWIFLYELYRYRTDFYFWLNSPQWVMASSFTRLLDHTQRRITVGRTPLDEWSVRRRDLYLTIYNTHNEHPRPRWDSNPQSQQTSGRRPTS